MPYYGEKYDELRRSTSVIENSGLYVPRMYPISQEEIDEQLRASGLPTIAEADDSQCTPEDVVSSLQIDSNYLKHLVAIATDLAGDFGGPVMTRSSGRADALGTGTYESGAHGTDNETLSQALKKVTASYSSDTARIFRERKELPPGFAAFIQSIPGLREDASKYPEDYQPATFTVPFSGHFVSSTDRYTDGYFRVETGYGGAVDDGRHPIIPLDAIGETIDPDDSVIGKTLHSMLYREQQMAEANLLTPSYFLAHEDTQKWSAVNREHRAPWRTHFYTPDEMMTLGALKQYMEQLDPERKRNGQDSPFYVEFVGTGGSPADQKLYIVQIGDLARPDPNSLTPQDIRAENIVIDGMKIVAGYSSPPTFGRLFDFTNGSEAALRGFDGSKEAQHGYAIAYHPRNIGDFRQIDIHGLKNLKAIFAIQGRRELPDRHSRDLTAHFTGYMDAVNLVIATTQSDTAESTYNSLMRDARAGATADGLPPSIIGPFILAADPRGNAVLARTEQ
ncbi:hypothetical protein CSA80_00740 [Candidatus Saccharibacteria bacterium]|nr:MAG: hypothetical protein CSA80_00740 [Candidatus Saccharibacteria bacterium]